MSIAPSRQSLATTPTPAVSTVSSGVPLLDVQRQYQAIRGEIAAAVTRVCDSGRFILGPDCEQLETALARYCQVPHAVACASGSDALLLALMAYGIGPGDEVLMPSYTFFATASAAWRLGARPVFVDIEPATFNIDPKLLERSITSATKAILPVHLFGQCAAMHEIVAIAKKRQIPIIEDAAQAVGAELAGRRAGSWGEIGCLSFYPTKNLGGFGDGGLLTVKDQALAGRLKLLRGHGMEPRYYHHVVGINSRLDSLQAAVLNVKLPYLDDWTAARQTNVRLYGELFAECGLERILGLPKETANSRHVWNQYVIRVPDGRRDALRAHLAQQKIGTEIYYPVPLHRQECFSSLGYGPGSLPHSEQAANETIALPIFPELSPAELRTAVQGIAAFFGVSRHAVANRPHL